MRWFVCQQPMICMRAYLLSCPRELFCFDFSVASGQSEGPHLIAMISVVCRVSLPPLSGGMAVKIRTFGKGVTFHLNINLFTCGLARLM